MKRWMVLGTLLASGACRAALTSDADAVRVATVRPASGAPDESARWPALGCFRGDLSGARCPRLALAEPCKKKRCLEPSGLARDVEHGIWVGVSDNYDDLIEEGPAIAGNVLFWFREDPDAEGVIRVRPLLSAQQVKAFPLYDLEGVTRAEDGLYLASGSWSLGNSRDRFHMARFRVVADGAGGFAATGLAWVAPGGDTDLRRWLIEKSGLPWTPEQIGGAPEKGGINLEALAFATSTAKGPRSLLLGLRGPAHAHQAEVWLLRVALGENDALRCESLARAEAKGGPSAFGLRSLEGIAGVPGAYLYLLGPSGGDYSPVYAGVALPGQATLDLGSMVRLSNGIGVVPEGIAAESVRDLGDGRVEVTFAAVDDAGCRFQKGALTFQRPALPAADPFQSQGCAAAPLLAPKGRPPA